MKKLFTTIIVLLLTVTVNVYAEDYNILVDENNNFTLKDSRNNPVTDNSIAKYENNTLTLGENTTFNEIKTKHDLTITSNDKEVSIKTLTTKEGNTYLPVNVNLHKLKVKDDDTYIFKIDIGGNYIINNSNIYSKEGMYIGGYIYIINSNLVSTGYSSVKGSDTDNIGVKIENSIVNVSNSICPINGGTIINSSEVDMARIYAYESKLDIINSKINSLNIEGQGNSKEINIESSTVVASYQLALFSDNNTLSIKESNVKTRQIQSRNTHIIIDKSDVKVGEENSGFIYTTNKDIEIKDSKLFVADYIQTDTRVNTELNRLIILNSEVDTGYIYLSDTSASEDYNFIVKNTNLKTHSYEIQNNGNSLFENCNINLLKSISSKNTVFKNCKGDIIGISRFENNLKIQDSILKFVNKEDFTAVIVYEDLIINNSNIIFQNENNKIAAFLQGKLILDDKIVPIDNERTILKTRIMTQEEKDNYTFSYFKPDMNKEIYLFAYENNEYSDYVKLATTKTINFRVKNGTWLDGTKDDIKLDYLYGEKIEVDSLPEEVKKLLTSKMGEWSVDLNNIDPTKDQEIEFRYNIINPETARNYIILIFVTLTVVILLKRQRKLVNR